jgi:hydrogenase small subunit
MPFMDQPPGAVVSTTASTGYGKVIRGLRAITGKTVDAEPKWRRPGPKLTTGAKRTW